MPTPIREKVMKTPENFTENTQSSDALRRPLFTQAFLPERLTENTQFRDTAESRVAGGTRHAVTGTTAQVDAPVVSRDDAIDDIPFVLGLFIKMRLHWPSPRTMP